MVEEKIKKLGLTVPEAAKPLAAYIPAIRSGNMVFTSGQVPLSEGVIKYKGKAGSSCSEEDAKQAAKLCALNCLSAIKSVTGSLDVIEQILKVTVFVASADGFTNQPEVANGASEFLVEIFGESGKHARSAVGVAELPRGAVVEVELIVKIKE